MEMEPDSLHTPLLSLRKVLKTLPKNPLPEQVHKLRADTRRVEAVAAAAGLDREKPTRKLLKTVKPVHSAAGKVRDTDVLLGYLKVLPQAKTNPSVTLLRGHLQQVRTTQARKLTGAVADHRHDARRGLKRLSRQVQRTIKAQESGAPIPPSPGSTMLNLVTELKLWPDLKPENLRTFRLKVKKLRSVLQLAGGEDSGFVADLGQVKNHIGEWHDWVVLHQVARKVVNPEAGDATLKKIQSIKEARLKRSLAAANALRSRYLNA
jgi:CHAD domain-containing protein